MRFDVLSGVCLALAWLLSLPETWAENGQTSQEEKPPIFWGEISEKGFQVGYRLYPESGIVDPGESLKVQFVLKNISRYPRCRSFALKSGEVPFRVAPDPRELKNSLKAIPPLNQ